MDLTADKAEINKLSVDELRKFGRDEILDLVSTGLLEEGRADEVRLADDQEKQAQQQQAVILQRTQAKDQKEQRQEDADWLQHMSQSYQLAFHQLMETYDNAERKYDSIEDRAEKLKTDLRDKAEKAYQHGVVTPDGTVAFYDRGDKDFVDANLQQLQGADAKAAADKFKNLSPQEQNANACYVEVCKAYGDAEDISATAKAGVAQTASDKQAAENSNGSISEDELASRAKDVDRQVDGLSKRMQNAENADANLDAALSAGVDDANNGAANANATSFANTADPANSLGSGNGKTSAAFNAAVNAAPVADVAVANNVPAPVNRLPVTPAP